MIVKKVVDASGLRSSVLEQYLAASPGNFAVITDFALFEMFKGNAAVNVRKSVAIISRFPKQVIQLKPHGEIARLNLRRKGLQKRLHDERETKGLIEFCREITRGHKLSERLAREIAIRGGAAERLLENFSRQAEPIRTAITRLADRTAPDELTALRKGLPLPPAFTEQFVRDVMGITALHLRAVLGVNKMPSAEDALFSFTFRYAVCAYALALRWLKEGGHNTAQPSTLRNDFVDMAYAAYATLFDGLITEDRKLEDMTSSLAGFYEMYSQTFSASRRRADKNYTEW